MSTSPSTVKAYENPTLKRRRVVAVLAFIGLVVGGTAVFTAIIWPGFAIADALPAPEPAAIAPAPDLQLSPLERTGEQTELVAQFPDIVGVWVQSGISGYMNWQNDNAVEAWTITYADGTLLDEPGRSPYSVQLIVGQWASASEASVFFKSQTKGITNELMSGQVTAAESGQAVGQYILATDPYDGSAIMWWRNGTVVIKAVGPIDLLPDFYSIYPL